jgi:hypothetical protein
MWITTTTTIMPITVHLTSQNYQITKKKGKFAPHTHTAGPGFRQYKMLCSFQQTLQWRPRTVVLVRERERERASSYGALIMRSHASYYSSYRSWSFSGGASKEEAVAL